MKTFYRYAALVAGSLLGLCGCSSDDDVPVKDGTAPLPRPQVMVSDLTTTGFTLRWEPVEGGASYVYTFDGGEETALTECRLAFGELERRKEYVVAVKAVPRFRDENSESAYSYIHVLTDDLEQLPQPRLTLGCAYASKTLISWTEVPETTLYEYTIDGKTYTTSERMVSLTNLAKDRAYTFSLRAMTSDATRFTNSEIAELPFTTSADDIPPIIIAPTLVISDAVKFDIYAAGDKTYYYEILPATTFIKFTPEDLMEAFQSYIVEYARKQGISLQLAMASLLKSGTQTLQVTGLTPELSYVIFAFGMNLKGEITSGLASSTIKTTADGYSDGPNYGGSDWFTQRFFISNAYAVTGYTWTNSVITYWKGDDVADIRYRTFSTSLFNQLFPDPNDKQAIVAFLKDPDYGMQFNPELIAGTVNGPNGNTLITAANAGTSYTALTLAISTGGEETLCVNSATTKVSSTAAAWFQASAVKGSGYGPTHNTFAGVLKGIDVAAIRYAVFPSSSIAGIDTSKYPAVIEDYGHDLSAENIPYVNGNGLALLIGGEGSSVVPETSYTFMATATNTFGDKITRWGSVTTDKAPAATAATTRARAAGNSADRLRSLTGRPIADPEKFIYPMESFPLPADARPEGDFWTIIHNTHNIK